MFFVFSKFCDAYRGVLLLLRILFLQFLYSFELILELLMLELREGPVDKLSVQLRVGYGCLAH